MTEDPENIKAVLATQFDDFGKGQLFRERWEFVSHLLLSKVNNSSLEMGYLQPMEKYGPTHEPSFVRNSKSNEFRIFMSLKVISVK
jgi:hypothetical protein